MFAKRLLTLVVAALLLGALLVPAVLADTPTYTENWDGRGTDSLRCDKLGESPERAAAGWIHWIFSTKGDSTDARLILGSTGSGTYEPAAPLNAETWHFFTPYFDLEGVTATVQLFGGAAGPGGGLVISDYCPGGFEALTVTKTAVTSFTRTHAWAIAKSVETENEHTLNGLPKISLFADGSGGETAT